MKTAGKVAVGLTVLAVGGGLLFWSSKASASSKTDDPSKPTFDPNKPGGKDKPKPKPKPGGGGGGGGGGDGCNGDICPTRTLPGSGALVFGTIKGADVPVDFDGYDNKVRFSNDCSVVLVGRQFLVDIVVTDGDSSVAGMNCNMPWDRNTTDASLKRALDDNQQLCAFLYFLVDYESITDPTKMLALVLKGLEPPCLNTPSSSWPPAMQKFVAWLKVHVDEFLSGYSTPQPDPDAPYP